MLLREDREDFDGCFCDVIEHPHLIYPEAILRPFQPTESLDTAAADFRGLVAEVTFDGVPHPAANVGLESLELPNRRWGQDDLEPHSGQIIARTCGRR